VDFLYGYVHPLFCLKHAGVLPEVEFRDFTVKDNEGGAYLRSVTPGVWSVPLVLAMDFTECGQGTVSEVKAEGGPEEGPSYFFFY